MQLQKLMKEYFDNSVVRQSDVFDIQVSHDRVPIVPVKNEWILVPEINRYARKFEFGTQWRRNEFVREVLKIEQETSHDLEVLLTRRTVEIHMYTPGVNQVTEIDLEVAREIDGAFRDVADYEFKQRRR